MKKGDKYILEVHEVVKDGQGNSYARMKNFNTLFFDRQGIDKLEPYREPDSDTLAFDKGFKAGMEEGWAFARVISDMPTADLMSMGFKMDCDFEDMSEYGISCNVILNNTVEEVDETIAAYNKRKSRVSSDTEVWNYIKDDINEIPFAKGSVEHSKQLVLRALQAYRFLND